MTCKSKCSLITNRSYLTGFMKTCVNTAGVHYPPMMTWAVCTRHQRTLSPYDDFGSLYTPPAYTKAWSLTLRSRKWLSSSSVISPDVPCMANIRSTLWMRSRGRESRLDSIPTMYVQNICNMNMCNDK